jgi:hypothetical protein
MTYRPAWCKPEMTSAKCPRLRVSERNGPSVTYGRLHLASLFSHSLYKLAFLPVIYDSFNTPIGVLLRIAIFETLI